MDKQTFAWGLLSIYIVITSMLAYRGWRRTRSMEGFAVGNRDMSPVFVGLSLAAQLTSVATFMINPGLVHAYGISAFLGMGVAASLGIIIGVTVLSKGFRRTGQSMAVLTLPGWFGNRYNSRALTVLFAVLSLALITFVVLILVAMALVLVHMLDVPKWAALAGIIVFVFGYVLLGGSNTSVYTNSVQTVLMMVVAVVLVGSGVHFLADGPAAFLDKLGKVDAALVGAVNPSSPYFRNFFEVLVCNFIVGLAIVCQPHIVTKALCLRQDRDVNTYLATAIGVGMVFMLVMMVGLYARLSLSTTPRIDLVVPTYINTQFSPLTSVIIGIGVLCAGISTLEGLLLALSAILASDLFFPVLQRNMTGKSAEETGRWALRLARLGLACLGAVAFGLSMYQIEHPTGGSVAIFAQYGIYCLFAVSFAPVVFGLFSKTATSRSAMASAVGALVVYLAAFVDGRFLHIGPLHNNPAVLATYSIFVGTAIMAGAALMQRQAAKSPATGGLTNTISG